MKPSFDVENSPPMFPINPSIPLPREMEHCPPKWEKDTETNAWGVKESRRKLRGKKQTYTELNCSNFNCVNYLDEWLLLLFSS